MEWKNDCLTKPDLPEWTAQLTTDESKHRAGGR